MRTSTTMVELTNSSWKTWTLDGRSVILSNIDWWLNNIRCIRYGTSILAILPTNIQWNLDNSNFRGPLKKFWVMNSSTKRYTVYQFYCTKSRKKNVCLGWVSLKSSTISSSAQMYWSESSLSLHVRVSMKRRSVDRASSIVGGGAQWPRYRHLHPHQVYWQNFLE